MNILSVVRNIYTFYTGSSTPVAQQKDRITQQIERRIFQAFNNLVKAEVTVTQTAQDIQNGFSATVIVALKGTKPITEWNVIIPVSRISQSSTSTTSSASS